MARLTAFQCLTLSLFLVSSVAFTTVNRNSIRSNTIEHLRSNAFILNAKKEKTESKGFAAKKVKPVPISIPVGDDSNNFSEGMMPSSAMTSTSRAVKRESQGLDGETDADAIFKKYGIKDGTEAKKSATKKKKTVKKNRKGEVEEAPFGQSVLAGISADAQMKIDNTLVTCVSLSLGFVVLSGISISLGAYTVVFPEVKIPEAVDFAITNFLSPAFTPALGVFFFFSTTFGLFKFAQISSDQTVYKEEVTRDL